MGEVVNVLVAFAVIVILFRWVTSGSDSSDRSPADTLGFRPKTVTQEMLDTIHNMFPDIPVDNIRYDLLRTGSVELTSNKILEKGFLDAPPATYYALFPRQTNTAGPGRPANDNAPAAGTAAAKTPKSSLIDRYGLQDRVEQSTPIIEEEVGGKAVWEDSAEKREASLRERKAQMILAARQRMLASKQKSLDAASTS